MILQALTELYSRLATDPSYAISPPGFSPQKISFRIVLRLDGTLHAIEDARLPDTTGKLRTAVIQVPGSAKPSGAGINPCFLWDNPTYLLGQQPPTQLKSNFGLQRFTACRQYHLSLEPLINDPHFSSVCHFLQQWDPNQISKYPILTAVGPGFGVFQILGEKILVHQRDKVIAWWHNQQANLTAGPLAQCLITGHKAPIARLHPKIKGVTDAQSSGAPLVSFNDSAYESFGKEQSYNSPISEEVAFKYSTALNSLLTGPMYRRHRLTIGHTSVVFWTNTPTAVENCFAQFFSGYNTVDTASDGDTVAILNGSENPVPVQDSQVNDQLTRLVHAIKTGSNYQDFGAELKTSFFILGLAPNKARLSVRFFQKSSVEDLITCLHKHHCCLNLIREFTIESGSNFPDTEFPTIRQILDQVPLRKGGKPDRDKIPPILEGALTSAIITGSNYPEALYTAIIRRIHADRVINYLRIAILKAILVRNHKHNIQIMLDLTNNDPAYRLGRLFATLEKTQNDALGNVNASIRDRFYNAASTTPASAFPRLLRVYQHHLAKLDGGLKVWREKLIQEILDPIQQFPTQLNMQGQGSFVLLVHS